jgi:hypothetical protein
MHSRFIFAQSSVFAVSAVHGAALNDYLSRAKSGGVRPPINVA